MTDEDRKAAQHRLAQANINPRVGKLTPGDLKRKAPELFGYLESPAFGDDTRAGIGLCLSGRSDIRSDCLGLIGKGLALSGRSTQFCTLHALVSFLHEDDERRKVLRRADYLLIDHFEKSWTNETSRPYTLSQIIEIEEFLTHRRDSGFITHFAATRPWRQLTWWSKDFLEDHQSYVREFAL